MLKQPQPLRQIDSMLIAVAGQRHSGHMLESQERLPRRIESRVVQSGDVGMREFAEDLAFACKPLEQLATVVSGVRQLQSNEPLDDSIAAPGPPHSAHATATDLLFDHVGSYYRSWRNPARCRRCARDSLRDRKSRQNAVKVTGCRHGVTSQQHAQRRFQCAIRRRQCVEPSIAGFGRESQRLIHEP